MISNQAYLILQSIDPRTNRFRIYQILIIPIQTSQSIFVVKCAWGRQKLSQFRQYTFESEKALHSFLKANLTTRKRHRYSIAGISHNFPTYAVLDNFSRMKLEPDQFSLF